MAPTPPDLRLEAPTSIEDLGATMKPILRNKEASGRIIKWAVELGTYTIDFRPHHMIKSQALANFIAEWMDM